jgi:hypothetical protein
MTPTGRREVNDMDARESDLRVTMLPLRHDDMAYVWKLLNAERTRADAEYALRVEMLDKAEVERIKLLGVLDKERDRADEWKAACWRASEALAALTKSKEE